MKVKKLIKNLLSNFYIYKIKHHKIKNDVFYNYEKAIKYIEDIYSKHGYGLDRFSINENNIYNLSLIVPVYNDDKYIEECINSLVDQDTNYSYEIIAIDDGSKDNSLNLLNKIKENNKDKNITIIHQENKGISTTRNVGLSLAKGEYIGFIDNDDFVKNNYVDTLLNNAYKYDADFVKCGYDCVKNNEIFSIVKNPFEIIRKQGNILINKYDGYIWSGIQKKTLWNNFCFPNDYWYEDMITKMYLYQKCNCFINVEDVIYTKRIHDKNASFFVWDSANYKCIDQLYLALELEKIKEIQGFSKNELSFEILINELSEMLYKRTINLDNELRKKIFVVSSEFINDKYKDFEVNRNDFCFYYAYKAFKNKDFKLWELIGEYSRFVD